MISSLAKDSAITFIVRSLALILAVVDSILIARFLGPSLNGSYRIILLIMNASSLFFLSGIGSAIVYFGARDPTELPALIGNSFLAAFGFGLLGIVGVEVATMLPPFRTYLAENGVSVGWIRGLILLLPLVQLRVYLAEIVRAKGDILRYNLVAGAIVLTGLVGTIALVVILKQGLSGALNAWIFSLILVTAWVVGLTLRMDRTALQFSWNSLQRSVTFGFRIHVGNVAQFLNYRLDVFLVALFLTPAAVGLYTTVAALAEILWGLPNAIRTVLLYQVAASEKERASATTARVSRIVIFVIGIMCLFVTALSYPLIGLLYGEAYLPAAPALMALAPGIWTLSLGKLLASHLVGAGRPEVTMVSAIISLVATVLLDVVLIPKWGIVGASVASSVSYTLSTIVVLYIFLRTTGLALLDVVWLRQEDVRLVRSAIAAVEWRRFGRRSDNGAG